MSRSLKRPSFRSPSQAWDAIEELILAFEQDFADGRARPLDEYLPAGDDELRRSALVELIKVDLELRAGRADAISLEAYCQRYPLLGSCGELPADLISEAFRAAIARDPALRLNDFCAAFPDRFREIQRQFERSLRQSRAFSDEPAAVDAVPFNVGDSIEDYELIDLLGEGAFARVFLARQVSLGRQVALKVSADIGGEGKTMAALEHDYIVPVFSESVVPEHKVRLLCMQYVSGATLGTLTDYLNERQPHYWTGEDLLRAIDIFAQQPALFHPAALKDRSVLEHSNLVESVAWIGARLAEALDYAHSRGVLHRDIKPDNVLVNQYGRPQLADFNLAFTQRDDVEATLGGTLGYMAPEHLAAFDPSSSVAPDAVRESADIYALGMVLYELASGLYPFELLADSMMSSKERLRHMIQQREEGPPPLREVCPTASRSLERVIAKCLAPHPADRFASARELAQALDGTRRLEALEEELPPPRQITRWALAQPLRMLVLLALLPHAVAAVVNIAYNFIQIVSTLSAAQIQVFYASCVVYNLIAWSLCVRQMLKVTLPPIRIWRRLTTEQPVTADELRAARWQVTSWGRWACGLACAGWFPGGLLFPLTIHLAAGSVSVHHYAHFAVSFVLSGLIALTYSFFGVELMALRVFYPQLLLDEPDPKLAARSELTVSSDRLHLLQMMAGAVPLMGVLFLLATGPEQPENWNSFRGLVAGLTILAVAGFALAVRASNYLGRTLAVLLPPRRTD